MLTFRVPRPSVDGLNAVGYSRRCALPDKLIDEVYLTLARYLRSVARSHFSVHAEDVLLHSEKTLLNILLIRLIKTLTIRTKVMIIAQPLKQPLFADGIAVLCNHLGEFSDKAG